MSETKTKKRPVGRPVGSLSRKPARDVVKQVRWTDAEWQLIEERAEAAGVKPSVFLRRSALRD